MAAQFPHTDLEQARLAASKGFDYDEGQIELSTHAQKAISYQNYSRTAKYRKLIVLSFRDLQLKRIAELQDELLILAAQMAQDTDASSQLKEQIDRALDKYASALRNYETSCNQAMSRVPISSTLFGTIKHMKMRQPWIPFYKTLDFARLDLSLQRTAGLMPRRDGLSIAKIAVGELGFKNLNRNTISRRFWLVRAFWGMAGGYVLVLPIVIMTRDDFRASVESRITVTIVATMLFALGMALMVPSITPRDILMATAGYTAVLVVFISTSSVVSSVVAANNNSGNTNSGNTNSGNTDSGNHISGNNNGDTFINK